jgi:hypothetical protein
MKISTRQYKFSKEIVMEALPLFVVGLEKANSDLTKPIHYRQFNLMGQTENDRAVEFINLTILASGTMDRSTAPSAFNDYCFRIIPELKEPEVIGAYFERLVDLYVFNRFLEVTNRKWDIDLTRRGETHFNVHLPILKLANKIARGR